MIRKTVLLSTAAAVAAGIAPASAQEQTATFALEEIVVTSRKFEESLQNAPISVSAVTEKTIESLGLRDMSDISRFSTGLSFSQAFGRTGDRPVIRGQSNVLAGVQFGVESGAAYFIDGVYYNGDIQSLDLESLARVEVIKGPQSALYGRNTYSGAINFITKDPGDVLTAKVKGIAAEHDEYEVAASVSGPLIGDKLGFQANARYFTYGGEYRNTLTGKKVGQEESKSVSLALVAKPTEDITIRLRGQYTHDDDGPLALFLQPAAENNCFPGYRSAFYRRGGVATRVSDNRNQYFCGVIKPRPDLIQLNTDPLPNGTADGTAFDGAENKQWVITNRIDWDLAGTGWTLASLTGYRTRDDWFGADSDHSDAYQFRSATTGEPLFANTNFNKIEDLSQELKIVSPQDARIRGLAGLYYYKLKDKGTDITFSSPSKGLPFPALGSSISETKNKAAFAMLTFDILDNLEISGELRHAKETKDLDDIGTVANSRFTGSFETTSTTPKVTLNFKPVEGHLLYAVYAKGVKPGGLNGSIGQAIGRPTYESEKADSYELGYKGEFMDGRMRINASAYLIKSTQVQLTTAVATGAGAVTSIATNQGDAETKGFEIDIQAAPTENLTLQLGYSYTDAKFTSGCDDFQYTLNTGGLIYNPALGTVPECDITGNRLPLGSPHILNGSANWESDAVESGDIKLILNANFSYESSKYVQVHNLDETGDTLLVGARAGLRGENWSISIFGRNLTNEDSIGLATRWFDLRHGSYSARADAGALAIPANLGAPLNPVTFQRISQPGRADPGSPRAFFGSLRKGRTFGVEVKFNF